jgi:hypothetical protein
LDRDPAIRRQVANADDSTDRSFAADQDRFDIASVFVADQIRTSLARNSPHEHRPYVH